MTEFTHRLPHAGWSKPSRNEEEYFHREEFRLRMALARKREEERAADERRTWLEAHADRCPKCGSELEEVRAADGTVDQCPSCLGVWMDHTVFDNLTHPDKPNEYLTEIFRGVLLQYTTGNLHGERPPEAKD